MPAADRLTLEDDHSEASLAGFGLVRTGTLGQAPQPGTRGRGPPRWSGSAAAATAAAHGIEFARFEALAGAAEGHEAELDRRRRRLRLTTAVASRIRRSINQADFCVMPAAAPARTS